MKRNAPAYNDGVLTLYRVIVVPVGDFPQDMLQKTDWEHIWYREISVFDKTRIALEERGKRIEKKIRIPQWRTINSNDYVKIDDHFYQIYNAAHTTDKDGWPITELTLIAPENNLPEWEGEDD